MTNEEQLESGQEAVEAQDKPSPEVPSVPSGVEQASAPTVDLDSIRSEIGELIKREFQSFKDVRLKNVDSNTANIERIMKYVKDADGDEELALRNMKIDEIYAREGVSQSEVPGRTEDETSAAFTAISEEILRGADIAFDDPGYLEFVARHNNKITTPETWRSPLQAWADSRRIQSERQEGVTPAASSSALGGTPPSGGDTDDELLEKIDELLKHPLQNIEEREKLIAEAKKRELMK